MKPILLLIVNLFFSASFFAQSNTEKKQLVADYYEKGVKLRYVQKDSAYYYLNNALNYATELGDYTDALEILIQSIFINGQYSDMRPWRSNLDKMEAILQNDSLRNKIEYFEYYVNRATYENGSYHYELKEYEQAKKLFLKTYKSLSQKQIGSLDSYDFTILVNTSNFLGSIYMNTGKYDLAENYYNHTISFIEQNEIGKKKGLDRSTNRLFSQFYILTGKYDKAEILLQQLLDNYKGLYKENKKNKNRLIVVFQRLVKTNILQDSLEKALGYLDESQTYLLPEDPNRKSSLILYGDIYSHLAEWRKAESHYQEALNIFMSFHHDSPHEDIAEVHGKITELYLKQEKYKEGLKTIQKAFNVSGNEIQIANDQENPDPEKVFSKTQLLYLLDIKLQLLSGIYRSTKENNYLKFALQAERDMLKTFDLLKREFDSKLDKQFLAKKAYPMFGRMLNFAHMAYEKNSSEEILHLALNIAEKNKDFILLEALRNAQATEYGNVPKNFMEREAQLRAEITNLEKQLFDATETENGFSDVLFDLKQEYYTFLDTIKSKYPKYHELKYKNQTLDLATVRKGVIDAKGTLISYTMTQDHLYAIAINNSKEDFLKLPFNEIDRQMIQKFYLLLSSPSINGAEKELSTIANSLFEKILKKPLAEFDTDNLTIIPDGELHYLPFDLLQENGAHLLETKSIGYGNSVSSLLELKEKENSRTNNMLAYAPSFSGVVIRDADRQFGKLLYNDDEVRKIATFFDSETILKERATLPNFKSNASKYNIVHLATHASANDAYPDYSYLAFSKTESVEDEQILYIKDLYNMSINADMVTLSACQTGIGKLQKGQGMLSLSKGFYYAGAKSLVNTLWKINDKSTVKLMEYFYEGLSKGYSKSEALRKAKLKYLETTDDEILRHPYYWAAFVVSGDVSPLTNKNTLWWALGGGVCALLLVGFFSKKGNYFKKLQLSNQR